MRFQDIIMPKQNPIENFESNKQDSQSSYLDTFYQPLTPGGLPKKR
jgi:hypothetical protein